MAVKLHRASPWPLAAGSSVAECLSDEEKEMVLEEIEEGMQGLTLEMDLETESRAKAEGAAAGEGQQVAMPTEAVAGPASISAEGEAGVVKESGLRVGAAAANTSTRCVTGSHDSPQESTATRNGGVDCWAACQACEGSPWPPLSQP